MDYVFKQKSSSDIKKEYGITSSNLGRLISNVFLIFRLSVEVEGFTVPEYWESDLPIKVKHSLRRKGVVTDQELFDLIKSREHIRGVGDVALDKIRLYLESQNYSF